MSRGRRRSFWDDPVHRAVGTCFLWYLRVLAAFLFILDFLLVTMRAN